MTAAEYADTAADQLYADGPPTAADVKHALADAWRAGFRRVSRRVRPMRHPRPLRADAVRVRVRGSVVSGSGERPTATEYLHLLRDVVRAIDPRRAIAADVELDLIRARCIVMGFDSFDDLYESWQAGRFALDK